MKITLIPSSFLTRILPVTRNQCGALPLAVVVLLLAAAQCGLAQNLVVNGSFETPVFPLGTYATIPADMYAPWKTTEPRFEVWANGYAQETPRIHHGQPAYAADGAQCLEILSTESKIASAWQLLPTVQGHPYTLSFYHSPRPGFHSKLTVSIDFKIIQVFDEDGLKNQSHDWKLFSTDFVAAASGTIIKFTDESTNTAAGTHIDLVDVEPVRTAVAHRTPMVIGRRGVQTFSQGSLGSSGSSLSVKKTQ